MIERPADPLLADAVRLWLRKRHVRAIDAYNDLADHLMSPALNFPIYAMRREIVAIWRDVWKGAHHGAA